MAIADAISAVLADSPAYFWDLQDAAAPYVDSGAGAQDLTVGSGSPAAQSSGPEDAFAVDYPGSAVLINTSVALAADNDFAIEFWIYLDTVIGGTPLRLNAPFLTCDFPDAHMRVIYQGVAILGSSSTTFVSGQWYQVGLVRDGGATSLYVNGALDVGLGGTSPTTSGTGIDVGAGNDSGGGGIDGRMTMVSLYNTALSSADILAHYDAMFACDPPENAGGSDAPVISGMVQSGDVVSVDDDGTWTGDPTITFTYQWYRVCGTGPEELIAGETASTYTLTDDDVGCDVLVHVIGDNGCPPDGEAPSNSLGPVTAGPPANITPPEVTGVLLPGHALSCTTGTWTGLPTSYDYQWYRDSGSGFLALSGETANEVLLEDEDIGAYFKCEVTANN